MKELNFAEAMGKASQRICKKLRLAEVSFLEAHVNEVSREHLKGFKRVDWKEELRRDFDTGDQYIWNEISFHKKTGNGDIITTKFYGKIQEFKAWAEDEWKIYCIECDPSHVTTESLIDAETKTRQLGRINRLLSGLNDYIMGKK